MGKEDRKIPSEQTARTMRFINLMTKAGVSCELQRDIIRGAKEEGLLGDPDTENCVEKAKRKGK